MKTVIILVLIIVVVANAISLARNVNCTNSNYKGSVTFEEINFNERNFDMCKRKFSAFKKQNSADTVLYRLCRKNILKFWNWGNYILQEKFNLPYISWQEIASRRGKLTAKSGFQDF